jgi:predicted Rossmann fold flavoprotein
VACRIAVVGGGAAGIYAALSVSASGGDATLFEKNRRIGIKILISGGGRCNITHDAVPGELERGFRTQEARFLRFAFHELAPQDVLQALRARGVDTATRPNGRVFPVSGSAEDVLHAFESMLAEARVWIRAGVAVEGIEMRDGRATGIRVGGVDESYDAVIVATGGMSYRAVGTTGDGIRWARELALPVEPVRAALAPIYFPAPPPADWQGVSLRDVVLRLRCNGLDSLRREGYATEWRDDVLLTHRGVSGPAVLEVSRAAALARERGSAVHLDVDLLPDLTGGDLLDRWRAFHATRPRAEVHSFVEAAAPRAVVPFILESCGIEPRRRTAAIEREARTRLFDSLKKWRIGEAGTIPLDRGEVTAGGVSLSAVDPRTMRIRSCERLYFAGEALDVAGSVGGYNLQAAFATGFVAGRAAVAECRS